MEFNKSVSNPMLVGAIELLKAEPSPEHHKMVSDEIVKAYFLAPAKVMEMPEPNAEGEIQFTQGEQHQIRFPMLTAPEGKRFFMAFTDESELQKWPGTKEHQKFSMTFEDYAGLLLRKDSQGNFSPAAGFVINPFGANLIVPREMVAQYIADRIKPEAKV